MTLLHPRNVLPFPPGSNGTDTIISGYHLNLTALGEWNYTLYSNGTLSNGSWCLLTFEPWAPTYLFPNGTFLNTTWCWSPVDPIGTRGIVAIAFAVLFGLAIVLSLVTLNKHGSLHLPATKRFYPIGRRWQWYWGFWVCATAIVSLLTSIDVDRYYLPELPVILTSFFWYLMQWGAMAVVWEAVRHWGSWMERQLVDPDPFALRQDDRRALFELVIPLFFYLFLWLNFFMIIPRNWTPIQHQRYPEQTLLEAAPTATDARFKAGAFLLLVSWVVILVSLRHSIKHYCPRNRGFINRATGLVRFTPLRFKLLIPLAAAVVAFQALVAFRFDYSPLCVDGNLAAIFAGGYLPSLLILYVQIAFGFLNPNEDLELKRQRRVRNQEFDRQMGIVHKPSWWRRVNGEVLDPNASMRERLAANARELSGAKPTPADGGYGPEVPSDAAGPVEMTPVPPPPPPAVSRPYTGRSETLHEDRAVAMAASLASSEAVAAREAAAERARRHHELMQDGLDLPPPAYSEAVGTRQGDATRTRSEQSEGGRSTDQPQTQVRSMLDV
ncbi:hypothetical protein VTJ83DRAFT_2856 [Remersonia thermophila]|uniref:Uncharacterized protein n=1 Tax=Remersonia thermophila TaxID=72144 RepID=A0ABR4DCD7_9PEZI